MGNQEKEGCKIDYSGHGNEQIPGYHSIILSFSSVPRKCCDLHRFQSFKLTFSLWSSQLTGCFESLISKENSIAPLLQWNKKGGSSRTLLNKGAQLRTLGEQRKNGKHAEFCGKKVGGKYQRDRRIRERRCERKKTSILRHSHHSIVFHLDWSRMNEMINNSHIG